MITDIGDKASGQIPVRVQIEEDSIDSSPANSHHSSTKKQLDMIYRKLDRRIIPALWCLYFLTSFGGSAYGVSLTMNRSEGHSLGQKLDLTTKQMSTASALDFVGSIIFDVPMNLIMTRVRPQSWLARIVVSVGLVYACYIALESAGALIALRFISGVVGAGTWPGMSYYISLWYPNERSTRRIGYYFTAAQISAAAAGLLSAAFQKMDGVRGYTGWQWLYLVYGCVTISVGISLLWWLPDRPSPIESVCDGAEEGEEEGEEEKKREEEKREEEKREQEGREMADSVHTTKHGLGIESGDDLKDPKTPKDVNCDIFTRTSDTSASTNTSTKTSAKPSSKSSAKTFTKPYKYYLTPSYPLSDSDRDIHQKDLISGRVSIQWSWKIAYQICLDMRLWAIIMMYFGVVGTGFGLAVFGSVIIAAGNPTLSSINVSLLYAPIWLFDLAGILLVTPFADRHKRYRAFFFSAACLVIICGMFVNTFAKGPWNRYGGLLIAGFGLGPTVPICMSWAAEIFGASYGDTGVAMSAALVSGLGNLGSVTATYALYSGWPADADRLYRDSNMVLVALLGVSIMSSGVCHLMRKM